MDKSRMNASVTLQDKVNQLEAKYFSASRGLQRDFGLTIFPFFTFFDSLLERVEIDLKNKSNKYLFFMRIHAKPSQRILEQSLQMLYHVVNQQWEGVQNDAADRFVERFASLLTDLHELCSYLPHSFANREQLVREQLGLAVKPFFSIEQADWQELAITSMGQVLGQRALQVLPTYQSIFEDLLALKRYQYFQNLEILLQEERLQFHQNLNQSLLDPYMEVCQQLGRIWHTFTNDIKPFMQ